MAPALEGAPLNQLRGVVGNDIAVWADRDGTLPFPAGKHDAAEGFEEVCRFGRLGI